MKTFSAVVCDLEVPESPNNTVQASHDGTSRNKTDPAWNTYLKKIKYSCPEGYVLETPKNDTEQVIGIREFDVMCDADRRWRPVLSYNPFPMEPIMPACICKFQYFKTLIDKFNTYNFLYV